MSTGEASRTQLEFAPAGSVSRRPIRALVVAARPRQWLKNVLVFVAPAAAGALGHPTTLLRAVGAGLAFVVASSGTYLLNDVRDIAADREHPVKRFRPIAAGEVPMSVAMVSAVLCILGAVAIAFAISGVALGACIASYVLLTTLYSLGLKRVPYLELLLVSAGFVLRAVAGGVAVHVAISPWFLAVTSSAAVLIATGKRTAEVMLLGGRAQIHRRAASAYSISSLAITRRLVGALAAVSYGLWAFSQSARDDAIHRELSNLIFFKLSVIPFVVGLVILELALWRGEGGEPEELALHNRVLQLCGLCTVGLVAAGIYV